MQLLHLLLLATLWALTPTALPTAITDPGSGSGRCDLKCRTDQLLFGRTISQFLTAKRSKAPPGLIWADDGCSFVPDKPSRFNFLPACQRHDFGYRNYKRQRRFTENNRARIDRLFKDDMYAFCNRFSGWQALRGVRCRRYADAYYAGVRRFGERR